jgi:hypothetical protein
MMVGPPHRHRASTTCDPAGSIHFVRDHIRIEGLADWCDRLVQQLSRSQNDRVRITKCPEESAAIVFLGSGIRRGRWPVRNHLKSHPLFKRFPAKCFVWCTEDDPLVFLPGLYASLPRRFFDPRRHRGFTYYALPTDDIPIRQLSRDVFYSFVGGITSETRRRLFEFSHPKDARIRRTVNYNHGHPSSKENREEYAAILCQSQFTLCPRGVGTASYRIFEAMRMGSVPVVLSDDWVEPDGPDWAACAVCLPETAVGNVAEQLEPYRQRAESMSLAARAAYDTFFSPDRMLFNILRLTCTIQTGRSWGETLRFYHQQSVGLGNRLANRLRQIVHFKR